MIDQAILDDPLESSSLAPYLGLQLGENIPSMDRTSMNNDVTYNNTKVETMQISDPRGTVKVVLTLLSSH